MTAPVFFMAPAALADAVAGSTIRLEGSEGRHAAGVRRMAAGEHVDVVDGEGRRVRGVVTGVSGRSALDVEVLGIDDEPRPTPWLTVVQALAKGDRGELAVELLTEVGVDEIVPWSAAHSVARWSAERAERGWRRWSDARVAAAKQSRRARFPELAPLADTAEVAARLADADVALVLHEAAGIGLVDIDASAVRSIVVVVGPEGGIADDELATFESVGARSVRLGPGVLRTSSAGMAAAAVLLASTGRWGAKPSVREPGPADRPRVEG